PRRTPRPHEIVGATVEQLRSAGLSINKTRAVQDLAAKTLEGVVPTHAVVSRLSDEEIIERLTAVRGVGRWTVEMFLMFRLGRPDVLPVDDYGVRKGFAVAFGRRELPTPRELADRGERWKPYRTVASWYLWRAAERATTPATASGRSRARSRARRGAARDPARATARSARSYRSGRPRRPRPPARAGRPRTGPGH